MKVTTKKFWSKFGQWLGSIAMFIILGQAFWIILAYFLVPDLRKVPLQEWEQNK